jgi:transposase InsO family protein
VPWIERTYHRRDRHRVLGKLTPIEFEAIMTTQDASAAVDAPIDARSK